MKTLHKDINSNGALSIPKSIMKDIGIDSAYQGVKIEISEDKIIITKMTCRICGADTVGAKGGGLVCVNESCKRLYWEA